jgi:phosphonate transport system ATP-binding protein
MREQSLPAHLLEVKSLGKCYNGTIPALDAVSFSVGKGEFISVIGPSGAGKSTLLRCINRMTEVSSGEVHFNGAAVSTLKKRDLKKLRSKIGMIFQHYNLVERLTVIENVLHGLLGAKSTLAGALGRYSREEKSHAMEILWTLGLSDQVYQRCDRLSGGQKQRVGIARALIQNPLMILCDEPIASLDPSASKIIMDHLKKVSKDLQITVIANLHQVNVALNYADRVLGINQGKLVFDGGPEELSSDRISQIYGAQAEELIEDLETRYAH